MPHGASPSTITETRDRLTKIVAGFREREEAEPVVFGNRRTPEAVVIPYDLYELIQDLAEELVIAAQLHERCGADDGTRYSMAEVSAHFGIDIFDL
ncbi:MAG: hypothetical protein ACR2HR_03315 [Euzebya sp.]